MGPVCSVSLFTGKDGTMKHRGVVYTIREDHTWQAYGYISAVTP
jgi:hypothetical protein